MKCLYPHKPAPSSSVSPSARGATSCLGLVKLALVDGARARNALIKPFSPSARQLIGEPSPCPLGIFTIFGAQVQLAWPSLECCRTLSKLFSITSLVIRLAL